MSADLVLVTGGGGFLGRAIVERLVARGQRVRTLCRRRYAGLAALGVEQMTADIAERAAVERACRGVRSVFHTAAKAGIWGPWREYWQTNVLGTENVLQACRAAGVAQLVYTSSPSVVFTGRNMAGVDESVPYPRRHHAPYSATKAEAERRVRQAARGANALAAVILRPHLIWGPRDNHLVPRILARAERLRRVGRRDPLVDTTYIDNAAAAHLLAHEHLRRNPSALTGRIYFISQGEPRPLWSMINAILAAGCLPPVQRSVPFAVALGAGVLSEALFRWLRLKGEPPMTRFVARELATDHWFDLTAARRDLGYAPEVSIEQGLERLAAWLRDTSASRTAAR
jgi:nucleoside-diphosphate-sugar epimerase